MHDQGKADRQALFNSFAVIAMIFSAGTLFFYYDTSRMKAEEVRQTVGSRQLLTDQIKRQTDAANIQTEAIKEFTVAVRALAKAVAK